MYTICRILSEYGKRLFNFQLQIFLKKIDLLVNETFSKVIII